MWETIQSGGPLMVPLIGCAVLALAFILERMWVYSHLPSRERAQEELDGFMIVLQCRTRVVI